MALTNLLKSPQFLCKQVKIYPPTAVLCLGHSQLAVQASNVEKPIIFFLQKDNKHETKIFSAKESKYAEGKLQLKYCKRGNGASSSVRKTNAHQALNAMWECVRTHDIQQNLQVDKSLLSKWNQDPLMDHKQLVLLVFDQDKVSNKLCSIGRGNVSSAKLTKHLRHKEQAEKVIMEQVCLWSDCETRKEYIKFSKKNCQTTSSVSHSRYSEVDCKKITKESPLLFAEGSKKSDLKKDFKIGPDPTQLSSVLLKVREEIPEFFLKTPDYSIYHQNVKFVNAIIGASTNGIYQYRVQIAGFRFMVLSCMTDLSMDVLKISKHPNEGAIKVRWRIKGIPLLTKILPYIGRRLRDGEDCYRYLDGFSVFEVGSDGLIHCHRLHKVMPSSSHVKESPLWMLLLWPFLHLLDSNNSCEAFSAFECRSTDKGIEPGIQV